VSKDEIALCINEQLARCAVPRTHANAQLVLESIIDHLEQRPETELTPELIRAHADLVLVSVLTSEFTN
jgi:hypothetical protein